MDSETWISDNEATLPSPLTADAGSDGSMFGHVIEPTCSRKRKRCRAGVTCKGDLWNWAGSHWDMMAVGNASSAAETIERGVWIGTHYSGWDSQAHACADLFEAMPFPPTLSTSHVLSSTQQRLILWHGHSSWPTQSVHPHCMCMGTSQEGSIQASSAR